MSPSLCRLISVRRTVALLLIPLIATSCHSWRTAQVEPRTLVETEQPNRIRVTTSDGRRAELDRPTVVGDSLVSGSPDGAAGASTRVAVADVARVEVRRFSLWRTTASVLGLAVIAAAALGVWCASQDCLSGN